MSEVFVEGKSRLKYLGQSARHAPVDLQAFFTDRRLIIVANRGPMTLEPDDDGEADFEYGEGGLVKALLGLCQYADATWISCPRSDADRRWGFGRVPLPEGDQSVQVEFLSPDPLAYDDYYSTIANPLLWFLQHSMWDVSRAPVIDRSTWDAWNRGYMAINRQFAEAIAEHVRSTSAPALVMLQDYHLYLVARFLRDMLPPEKCPTILHFTHIPWPGPEYWRILPFGMRETILEGLCAADLLGFQTCEDGLNFIRTCETLIRPLAETHYRRGAVVYDGHTVHVRDFPISINVDVLRAFAKSEDVATYRSELREMVGDRQLIVRVDRIEPSKNIVRGFLAFDELLEDHEEYLEEVIFLAVLVPSRLQVDEYKDYLDDIMATAGRVNATYGTSDWEPVRVLVGENYPRAIAALQLYDVLLVNSIADGMNLVAKEGPVVNRRDGVLILSERTGAYEQLCRQLGDQGALATAPCDVHSTAQLLHHALTMLPAERRERAANLLCAVEREDIVDWLNRQLQTVVDLGL